MTRGRPLRIAVVGANGRMGSRLCAAIETGEDLVLAGRADAEEGLSQLRSEDIDVVVEFTRASAVAGLAVGLADLGRPWLSGTTGLDNEARAALSRAAERIPTLWAPNTSLGVACTRVWLGQAARVLPPDWSLEIVETHHSGKQDAPSGTALDLAAIWQKARGGDLRIGREGQTGIRRADEIGIHAVRLPGAVGEHRLLLGNGIETIEIQHRAGDREVFVRGALDAAEWLAGRPAGLYGLDDWARDRLGA